MVATMYQRGKALNTASHFEIDEVIDPAESRARVLSAFGRRVARIERDKRRPFVDTW